MAKKGSGLNPKQRAAAMKSLESILKVLDAQVTKLDAIRDGLQREQVAEVDE